MTDEQITVIRSMRACNVPWKFVAKEMNHTIQECREALRMPVYAKPADRVVLPWEQKQQTLPFDQ